MRYLTLALMTFALLATAPAAVASCHTCVDATVQFVECSTSTDEGTDEDTDGSRDEDTDEGTDEDTDAASCGEGYVNYILFHDH